MLTKIKIERNKDYYYRIVYNEYQAYEANIIVLDILSGIFYLQLCSSRWKV